MKCIVLAGGKGNSHLTFDIKKFTKKFNEFKKKN